MARINRRRLALSLAVVGVVAVPLTTGSAKRFDQYANSIVHPEPPMTCREIDELLNGVGHKVDCKDDPTPPSPSFDASNKRTVAFARDVAAGLFVPFLLVFLVPAIGRRYARWLTG